MPMPKDDTHREQRVAVFILTYELYTLGMWLVVSFLLTLTREHLTVYVLFYSFVSVSLPSAAACQENWEK